MGLVEATTLFVPSTNKDTFEQQTRSIFVKHSIISIFLWRPRLVLQNAYGIAGSDDGVAVPPHVIAENEDDKRGNHYR
jgi:hypothetical protein